MQKKFNKLNERRISDRRDDIKLSLHFSSKYYGKTHLYAFYCLIFSLQAGDLFLFQKALRCLKGFYYKITALFIISACNPLLKFQYFFKEKEQSYNFTIPGLNHLKIAKGKIKTLIYMYTYLNLLSVCKYKNSSCLNGRK